MDIPGVLPDMPTTTLMGGLTNIATDLLEGRITLVAPGAPLPIEVITQAAVELITEAAVRLAQLNEIQEFVQDQDKMRNLVKTALDEAIAEMVADQ